MLDAELLKLPISPDKRSIHIADIALATVDFLNTVETNPKAAHGAWNRLREEYGEHGEGYSDQEFDELTWYADDMLGILDDGGK